MDLRPAKELAVSGAMATGAAACAFAAAATPGYGPVPPLVLAALASVLAARSAAAALSGKEAEISSWWSEMSGACAEAKARGKRVDAESAEGIWAAQAAESAARGPLAAWQAEACERAGIELAGDVKIDRAEWKSKVGPAHAVVLAPLFAGVAAMAMPMPSPASAAFCCIAATSLVCSSCDIAARIIPWQGCAALGVCGIALQAFCGGAPWAVLIGSAVWAAGCIARRSPSGRLALGAGDVRMGAAAACAAGTAGAAAGAAAFALATVPLAIVSLARRETGERAYIPMGPAIAAYAIAGSMFATLAHSAPALTI